MQEQIIELIEYRGFKNKFFGLVKDHNNNYYLAYAKTGTTSINLSQEVNEIYSHIKLLDISKNIICNIEIPIIVNNNKTYITFIKIANEIEYNNLVRMVKDLT